MAATPEGNLVDVNGTARPRYLWAVLRLAMGWLYLWPFLDKVFGLGFSTQAGKTWLDGVSPTLGFLKFGSKGPLKELFAGMAGNVVVDWLYMLGLLGIGVALLLGAGVRVAAVAGILMLALIYLAAYVWPEHNPFLDDHVIYAIVLAGLPLARAGRTWGIGAWWAKTPLVRRYAFLE